MEYIVALMPRSGDTCFYVEDLSQEGSSTILRHTSELAEARRYSYADAEQVADRLFRFRWLPQIQPVERGKVCRISG